MIASAKISLNKRRLKNNGTYPVMIKVIFNRAWRAYATGISLTENEFSKFHLLKNLKKDLEDVQYYVGKADNIIKALGKDFSWEAFQKLYYSTDQSSGSTEDASNEIVNVFSLIEDYEKQIRKEGRISTADSYQTTLNHLKTYLGKSRPVFLLSELNSAFLKSLEKEFLKKGLSYSSIGIYMRNIRAIFNQAIAKKIISKDAYPFGKNKYTPPATKKAKKALDIEDIEKIYNYKSIDPKSIEAWAKDMWLFAYNANGINLKDIANLKYVNINKKKKSFSFIREKTVNANKENIQVIEVIINEDIQRIIDKWGTKPIHPDNYIFGILSNKNSDPKIHYRAINQAIKTINKYMKRIATELGLERMPTTNFARHSFSTILKRAGVPIEMISELLGHTSIKTTQIYLGSFKSEQKEQVSNYLNSFKNKE